jgi:hypothetical protein
MQLGKLGVYQADQELAGKTGAKALQTHQWHSGEKENPFVRDHLAEVA